MKLPEKVHAQQPLDLGTGREVVNDDRKASKLGLADAYGIEARHGRDYGTADSMPDHRAGRGYIQALRESKDKAATLPMISRVFGIPVLKIEEASLAPGQQQKLAFRLPPDVPDTIEIPLELPRTAEGATVDVSLSSLGETIWSARAIALRAPGDVLHTDLRIPRASIQPHFGRPLRLDIVERGHATLGTFQITFEFRENRR